MKLWKRNAVVAAIVLFVCVAVYLNWSYSQDGAGETADTGKVLGEAALVGGKATDPLLKGEDASSPAPSESPAAGEEGQSSSCLSLIHIYGPHKRRYTHTQGVGAAW